MFYSGRARCQKNNAYQNVNKFHELIHIPTFQRYFLNLCQNHNEDRHRSIHEIIVINRF